MEKSPINRREFLKTLCRLAGIGILGGITAGVVLKNRRLRDSGQTCGNDGWCRPCPVVADCGLPRALSFRSQGVNGETWGREGL